jgi:hypothetical protein
MTLLVAGDRVFSAVGKQALSSSSDRFVQLYEGMQEPGILIVGNSRADRHFPSTRLEHAVGIDVANLGLGGVSMSIAELLVRDYVDSIGPPALLIVEVSNLVTSAERVGDMQFLGLYSERIRQLTFERAPEIYYASTFLNLMYFNSKMAYRAAYGVFRVDTDRLHRASVTQAGLDAFREGDFSSFASKSENEQALRRIRDFAEQNDVPVVLVLSPYLKVFDDGRRLVAAKGWVEQIESRVHVSIHDYSDSVTSPEHFRDRQHLNARGVQAFIDRMIADNVFENSDTDMATIRQRWNEQFR